MHAPCPIAALCQAQKYISMELRLPVNESAVTIVPGIPSASTCVTYCLENHRPSFAKFDPASLECACVKDRVTLTFPFVTELREMQPENVVWVPVTKVTCKLGNTTGR